MPPKRKDLTGMRFGKLTAVRYIGTTKARHAIWECRCDCGTLKPIDISSAVRGAVIGCGCVLRSQGGQACDEVYTYKSWSAMIRRCEDKKSKWYKDYGARGISVYFDWLGDGGFVNFLRDMGPRPPGKTLDRYPDLDGNYGPDNCRWATAREQRYNQRRMKPKTQPWTAQNLRSKNP